MNDETFFTTTGLNFSAGHYLWDREPHRKVEKFVRNLRLKINSTWNCWVLDLILQQYMNVEIKRFGNYESNYGNLTKAMVRSRRNELLAQHSRPPKAKAIKLR